MHGIKALFALLLAMTSVLPGLGYADGPSPGMYEIGVKIENSAIGLSQTQTSQQCISSGEFEKGPRAFLNEQQQGSDCNLTDYSMSDGKISMMMNCVIPGGGNTTVQGSGNYTNDSFQLTNKMTMEVGGRKMNMQTVATGNRVDDC